MAYKGINWGTLSLQEDHVALNALGSTQSIFKLEYKNISNSTVNKNDIIIETAPDVNENDCMCEIRFHVECVKEEQEENENGEQVENEEAAEGAAKKTNNVAQQIYKQIVQRAKIGEFAGQSIATLNQVNLVVPRGKYSVDFYQKNLRFHGITYSYNIDYKNIRKGFILPMANQAQTSFVLQLEKPIYQGQTVYPYIVIQIKKEVEVQVKTKLKPEHQKMPHLAKLKAEYNGPMYDVFGDIIGTCAQIQLVLPGKDFVSKSGQQPCIKCGVKAQSGWLYFLKKSLIFIPKPVTYFKTDDIKKVEFLRLGTTNKQFDMKITLTTEKKSIQYGGIQRVEKEGLVEYFKSREVKVQMEQTDIPMPQVEDDESEDEDFEGGEDQSSSSEDSDEDEDSGPSQKEKSQKKNKKEDKQPKADKEAKQEQNAQKPPQ